MSRIIVSILLTIGIACIAQAQLSQTGAGLGTPTVIGGGCSQATTFLARTSGLSGTETTAYTNMICGLVTDSIITGTMTGAGPGATGCGSILDGLYIFAANTTTTAQLNLCGTSFGLTQTGTVTFTADTGYAGNGTTGFFNTGFNPSVAGGALALNSSHLGAYVRTSRTTNATTDLLGSSNGVDSALELTPLAGGQFFAALSDGAAFAPANANTQGYWIASRTGVSADVLYKNGSSSSALNNTSISLNNLNIFVAARNVGGSAQRFSTDQISAIHFGGSLNATQVGNLSTRVNGLMTVLGVNVY
jgi:hypothetical protein